MSNTIENLTTQDAQVDCFPNAAAHLEPGGCFVIEVEVPQLQRLAARKARQLRETWSPGVFGLRILQATPLPAPVCFAAGAAAPLSVTAYTSRLRLSASAQSLTSSRTSSSRCSSSPT